MPEIFNRNDEILDLIQELSDGKVTVLREKFTAIALILSKLYLKLRMLEDRIK